MDENELSHAIIGAAIEVHRVLGPGIELQFHNNSDINSPGSE
jgi:hypothetical protein